MSDRTERLVTLVCVLRAKRPFASRAQLIESVPGYAGSASDEALEQMFERDKRELREIGIPITTMKDENETVVGYTIPRESYEMTAIAFTPAELAAINVAAQVWDKARLGSAATTALRKIETTTDTADTPELPTLVRHRADEAAIPDLLRAAREQTVIEFDYLASGMSQSKRRRIDPWGVVLRGGHWYVVGHDHDRSAVRAFRASRIVSAVKQRKEQVTHAAPDDVDLAALVGSGLHDDDITARVRVRAGMGAQLRQRALAPSDPSVDAEIEVRADRRELLRMLCASGAGAVVLEPADLREAVSVRLRAVLDAHQSAAHDLGAKA